MLLTTKMEVIKFGTLACPSLGEAELADVDSVVS
jgi:hypothetical protein